MSDPTDPRRAEGPTVVTAGEGGPQLIVLDPAGLSKHGELPATWRPLAEDHRIVWCREPSEGALSQADDLLGDADPGAPPISVVASGPLAGDALALAERHPGAARRVLLVDPAAEGFLEADDATDADADWMAEHRDRVTALREAGTEVRVIAHSRDDERDRVPAPLPLGHPDVAAAVAAAVRD
ncbi:hypothetical protein [Amycolatopsis jiangsuensis]|uniref:Alpha/beta hydrolase n=1 Tax=Amycolatopsis jiangsuensis TaxID=1181879 RepID=A0A840IPI4_9PSEU|nr:hypothetical protein [Amycolatopsis jiangsuensis]MBB4683267.1 hypothetical protein [Amycolatopsis jiangsuensis]